MEQLPLPEPQNLQRLLIAPPVMPWRDFADWIQISQDAVEMWIRRGYLPTVKIGRFRLVNVALFTQQLLNDEQEV
ncbi:MAG: DNA-binding protein [Gammaproteobacteria bacterium]|nr:DNA-binding protein [Gammaproteobacteria bacterium]